MGSRSTTIRPTIRRTHNLGIDMRCMLTLIEAPRDTVSVSRATCLEAVIATLGGWMLTTRMINNGDRRSLRRVIGINIIVVVSRGTDGRRGRRLVSVRVWTAFIRVANRTLLSLTVGIYTQHRFVVVHLALSHGMPTRNRHIWVVVSVRSRLRVGSAAVIVISDVRSCLCIGTATIVVGCARSCRPIGVRVRVAYVVYPCLTPFTKTVGFSA